MQFVRNTPCCTDKIVPDDSFMKYLKEAWNKDKQYKNYTPILTVGCAVHKELVQHLKGQVCLHELGK